jgi:hypothetical protein
MALRAYLAALSRNWRLDRGFQFEDAGGELVVGLRQASDEPPG